MWVGAPTAAHPKGSVNAGNVLIGGSGLAGSSGGARVLTPDNAAGFYVHVADPSLLYLKAVNSGDAVEYAIER